MNLSPKAIFTTCSYSNLYFTLYMISVRLGKPSPRVGPRPLVGKLLHAAYATRPKMVVSCCAFGCKNRFGKNNGKSLGFYRFPSMPEARRKRWIAAVKRKNWSPSKFTRICGDHFVSGRLIDLGR